MKLPKIGKSRERFTETQIDNYIRSGANVCLFCKSKKIKAGKIKDQINFTWRKVTCLSCDKSWKEIFKLIDIEV